MARPRALAAALLRSGCLVGVASSLSAQESTVAFTGIVRDGQGEPVAGATVVARGAVERGAVTDRAGAFRLGPLPAGTYAVRVEAIGYRSLVREIVAREGAVPVEFVVELAPIALAPLQVVAATRAGTNAASLPVKVDVIDAREVELQQSLVANPTELLSNLIPSFSPARQKLSTAGESFRGCRARACCGRTTRSRRGGRRPSAWSGGRAPAPASPPAGAADRRRCRPPRALRRDRSHPVPPPSPPACPGAPWPGRRRSRNGPPGPSS